MRHNHKNHIGSPCRFVFDFLPNWKNRNPHRSPKSEKPRYFCPKKRKTGNHNGQQNRKTDLKHGQNRKTENLNAPSRRKGFFNLLSQKKWRVGLRYELITKPERFLSFSIDLCFVIITMFSLDGSWH